MQLPKGVIYGVIFIVLLAIAGEMDYQDRLEAAHAARELSHGH
jgi:hypothetical protein